jgi:hypothetical protein
VADLAGQWRLRPASSLLPMLALSACVQPQVAHQPVRPPFDSGWRTPIGTPDPDEWDEFFALHFGERNLDPDFLAEAEGQFVLGLELWGHPPGSPVDLEFGFFASAPWDGSLDDWGDALDGFPDEEQDDPRADPPFVEGTSTLEFAVGVRKEVWLWHGALRPYVSGGLSAQRVRAYEAVGAEGEDDADGVLGFYGQVGVGWCFANGSRIGLGFRFVEAGEVEVLGRRGDADSTQWTLSFGFGY